MKHASTLLELLMVLAILAILMAIAVPRFIGMRDRMAVLSAATELRSALTVARHFAVMQGRLVAVRFDTILAVTTTVAGPDTLQLRTLGAEHGVSLTTTRDSIAYGPTGRGYGASNTSIVIARGVASDTVFVSRLGRVR